MTITVDTFFSGTLNTVDAVIGHFVSNAYAHFIDAHTGLITALFTMYVMFIGYQFIHHNHHFNLSTVMKHLVVMLCVYGLVMNWNLYQLFIYNIFTKEPGNVAQILIDSAGALQGDTSIAHALDAIYAAAINASMRLFGQVSFSISSLSFIVYAGLVFLIGSLLCVFALLLFIYAKMMMAIALALGPIFILFILWETTKGMFSAWLNKLVTLALIPVVTSAVLVLMLSVINVTLPSIDANVETLQFYGLAPFLGLCLATTLILSQVFRICSSLGGGIALVSISAGAAIAQSAIQKSGLAAAGRGTANIARNQVSKLKNRMRKKI